VQDWYGKGVPFPDTGARKDDADLTSNRMVYHNLMQAVWQDGDLSALDRYIGAGTLDYSPIGTPEPGTASFAGIVSMFRAALSDVKLSHSDMAEGKLVAHFWKISGIHDKGHLFGVPPTNKQITLNGISTVEVGSGKIVGRWAQLDIFGLLVQLGLAKPL
jgi:predicted ester cyclase